MRKQSKPKNSALPIRLPPAKELKPENAEGDEFDSESLEDDAAEE